MSKKQRIGSDPFGWIRDSRQDEAEQPAAPAPPPAPQPGADAVPLRPPQEPPATTRQGLREGWKRHTFIVREQHLEKIQAVAYWERRDIKEVIDEALQMYLREKDIRELP